MGKGSPTPEDQLAPVDLARLYTPDKYVCKLTPELKIMAKKDLREDDKIRDQALDQLRQWIIKTDYIRDCRLDANFLLRFCRQKKFNIPMAQETLVKYITMRQQNPNWFFETSMHDPAVLDLINRGVAFALPQRDKLGRRVLFTVGGNIDPNYHTAEHVMKAIMVVFESLLEDEENQIRGFSYILDEGGITMNHIINLWNPSEISKIWGVTEKGMPMRHKRLDFIKLPNILAYVFDFAKSLMSQKLQSRIVVHKDPETLRKNVDTRLLPQEYGGEIPMQQMIEMFKDEVRERQGRLLALDRMRVDVNLMKKASGDKCGAAVSKDFINGITGSFKKLEFD